MARGISWPFRVENGEFPATSDEDVQIAESLRNLLQTKRGERLMRPDFGVNSERYLFETNNAILGQALKYEVATAIAKYEPRVAVKQIRIGQTQSELTLTIEYVVKATRQDRDLQVRFRRN